MQTHDFEPMSISRILDSTFRIYKENFIRFITIVAIIQIPIGLLSIVSRSVMQMELPSQQESSQDASRNSGTVRGVPTQSNLQRTQENRIDPSIFIFGSISTIAAGILSMLGHLLCRGALAKSVSEVYLGNEISVGQAYRYILPKSLSLIGAGILVVTITYLGMIFLVVPGIIFALWFALTTPAIVIEGLKATKAMSRSKALASGNLDKILSVGFLVILISIIISIPFGYAGTFFGEFFFSGNVKLVLLINQLTAIIGQILIVPIGAIAYILLYYDLRIRKEGFDLEMLANSIGSEQGGINVGQSYLPDSSEI